MMLTLTDEHRQSLQQHPGRPLELRDEQSDALYIFMSRQQFETLVYDDSDLSADELLAAAAAANRGRDGWDAEGMDIYDSPAYDAPTAPTP
jgi:hypothetical protein